MTTETHPVFDIEFTPTGKSVYKAHILPMSYLHMTSRFGPVTTARLLCGDQVERYQRDLVRIVGMRIEAKLPREPAL
jgi:hypothetical protein